MGDEEESTKDWSIRTRTECVCLVYVVSVQVVSMQVCSGMSGRGEDVVSGGSTAFKVMERQQQALASVGLTDASGFLELG